MKYLFSFLGFFAWLALFVWSYHHGDAIIGSIFVIVFFLALWIFSKGQNGDTFLVTLAMAMMAAGISLAWGPFLLVSPFLEGGKNENTNF